MFKLTMNIINICQNKLNYFLSKAKYEILLFLQMSFSHFQFLQILYMLEKKLSFFA